MEIPKYIQNKIRQQIEACRKASKLEAEITDDGRIEAANYEIRSKFQQLSSLVYDYLTLKFSSDSYMSNKYFYEQTKTAILILFQILNNSHNEIKMTTKRKK